MSEEEEAEVDQDAEAPASRKAPGNNWTVTVVGSLVFLVAVLVLWPMVLRQRKAADRTTAISHLKGISLASLEFDQEFGSLPSEKTAEEVKRSTNTELDLSGTSSNAIFLLAVR